MQDIESSADSPSTITTLSSDLSTQRDLTGDRSLEAERNITNSALGVLLQELRDEIYKIYFTIPGGYVIDPITNTLGTSTGEPIELSLRPVSQLQRKLKGCLSNATPYPPRLKKTIASQCQYDTGITQYDQSNRARSGACNDNPSSGLIFQSSFYRKFLTTVWQGA